MDRAEAVWKKIVIACKVLLMLAVTCCVIAIILNFCGRGDFFATMPGAIILGVSCIIVLFGVVGLISRQQARMGDREQRGE